MRSGARRLGGGQAIGELGRRAGDDAHQHVEPAAPDAPREGAGEDAGLSVVGRDHTGHGVGAEVPLVAVQVQPGPVAVGARARSGARAHGARVHAPRDRRADAIGPDDEAGTRLEPVPVGRPGAHTGHPPAAVTGDVGDGGPEAELGAGLTRGVDEDRIEHGPSRRVQGVDTGGRLDVDGDGLAGVAERGPPDRRRSGGDDLVEEAPARELQHAGAHQAVRRQCVGAVVATVDDEHVEAGTGEEECRRRARGAGADDDDVGVGLVHGMPLRSAVGEDATELAAHRSAVGDVLGHVGGVTADAADEVGVAEVLEALAEHVQAGRGCHTAALAQLASARRARGSATSRRRGGDRSPTRSR